MPALPPLLPGQAGTGGKKKKARKAAVVEQGDDGFVAADGANANAAALTDSEALPGEDTTPRKRSRISVLTHHEALSLFSDKGIYVSEEDGILRSSANHKPCGKWDVHRYNRHFGMKVYKKYAAERLRDPAEQKRLLDAKERYFRMNPIVEEARLFGKGHEVKVGKMLSVDELRMHEKHWMQMWKAAKNELKQLRNELKVEMDEEVRSELMADIEGLKKRKNDWGKLLSLDAPPEPGIF